LNRDEALKLIQAARTALALIEVIHSTLWELYPDQILAIKEDAERKIAEDIVRSLTEGPGAEL